jgi:hypothetical protein
MGVFDFFKRRGRLNGIVVVSALPPHLKFAVDAAILKVGSIPHSANDYRDVVAVKELDDPIDKPLVFSVKRPIADYFVAINLWVLFDRGKTMELQTEWLFPMENPVRLNAHQEQIIEIQAVWPSIPPEKLKHFGTVHPDGGFTPSENA